MTGPTTTGSISRRDLLLYGAGGAAAIALGRPGLVLIGVDLAHALD
jgi:hypothetical protein